MSKYCPIVNHGVIYLNCQECEDKKCNDPGGICRGCINFLGLKKGTLFGRETWLVNCKVYRNNIFGEYTLSTCEFRNKNVDDMKICMNCSEFLGMGDFGLSCKKHYHRTPTSTTKACEDFSKK